MAEAVEYVVWRAPAWSRSEWDWALAYVGPDAGAAGDAARLVEAEGDRAVRREVWVEVESCQEV